ncbi:MAG: InlB B-repeat-containing protein [Bacteroidales bacterium]|nr:InlB B-repeat-containing protein [Bacteroidales bacterium]
MLQVRGEIPQRQMETIGRGLVAVKSGNNTFLSWRLLGTDPADIRFNVYRNSETTPINTEPLDAAHTNFTVAGSVMSDVYSVAVLTNGVETERSAPTAVLLNQYLPIPVEKPVGRLWNGSAYVTYTAYSIGDGSVADLDGDGQYEIVFLWMPDNAQDNSIAGHTANVFMDAYKLDGTKLWGAGKFIDLGPNLRAGAHYSPFLVFDFDGDGKAEIILKTADGTKDTDGLMIGVDVNHANNNGYILTGTEYLSVFEGNTGKLLATEPYRVARGTVTDWGDNYGNRVDRFLAAVAYLDGVHPSAVMCRGYYKGQNNQGRTGISTWNWDGVSLSLRWIFDTGGMENGGTYTGQGNHNLSVADTDNDGKDEIIYGSLALDDDGKVMYTTGFGHGDAMHVGRLNPAYPGLLMMGVHEEFTTAKPGPGMEMHDAQTGEVIWHVEATKDIGRGLTADIDSEYVGEESWSSGGLGVYAANGTKLTSSYSSLSVNMAIWWDGNTGRELFDGGAAPSVTRINASTGTGGNRRNYASVPLTTFTGASTNGGTKNNPCLQADILGDWREELILRATDNSELRVYITVIPTEHSGAGAVPQSGIPTLMHNKEYRLAVAWQNSGYNQPPHTDFFLGYNMVVSVVFQNEGKTVATQQIRSGEKVAAPAAPERTGYTFLGWYANATAWDFDSPVTANLTLVAKWTGNPYALYFDANGGTVSLASKTVTYDAAVGTLPDPTRAGYTFDGWNTAQDGAGTKYTAATVYNATDNTT